MTDTTTPPPGPPYYQLTHTTHTIVLTEAPDAGKRLGNGYRRILPDEMKVTVYRPGEGHIEKPGRSIPARSRRPDGPRRGVGWSIGGRWDETAKAPAWAVEIARVWIGGEQ